MNEKQFTVEDIEDMIYQLGVLISDASHGLLITTSVGRNYLILNIFNFSFFWFW